MKKIFKIFVLTITYVYLFLLTSCGVTSSDEQAGRVLSNTVEDIALPEVDVNLIKASGSDIVYTIVEAEQEVFWMARDKETQEFFVVDTVNGDVLDFQICNDDSMVLLWIDGSGAEEYIRISKVDYAGRKTEIAILNDFFKDGVDNCYTWSLSVTQNEILVYSPWGYVLFDFSGEKLEEKYYEEKQVFSVVLSEQKALLSRFVNGERHIFLYNRESGEAQDIMGKFDSAGQNVIEKLSRSVVFECVCLPENNFGMITDYQFVIYYEKTGEFQVYLNWSDYGLSGDDILTIGQKESGDFYCLYKQGTRIEELVWDADNYIEKEKLLLACFGQTTLINNAVAAFNQENPDYMIEIYDYKAAHGNEALNFFYNDLLAGKGADIVSVDMETMDYYRLARSGALENLTEYMAQSETISIDALVPNVKDMLMLDEGIYMLPTNFTIGTMIANNQYVTSREYWGVEAMITLLQEKPELMPTGIGVSKTYMLRMGMRSKLMHEEYSTEMSNTDAVISYLKLANHFPTEDVYNVDNEVYRAGEVLFQSVTVSSMEDYLGDMFVWGEYGSCLGYPDVKGNGAVVWPINAWAISSKSKYKDIAWKYIESFFSKEWADSITPNWDFSVLSDKLEEQIYADSRVAAVDEDGRDVPITKRTIGGERFYIYGATEEEMAELKALIAGATVMHRVDTDIVNIIEEEAGAYFSGDKPVEEVAEIIANRLGVYQEEMRE